MGYCLFRLSDSSPLLLALAAVALAATAAIELRSEATAVAGPAGAPQLHPAPTNSSVVEAAGLCASIVNPLGYECQEFEVKTQDGYLLTVHRIPQGRGAAADDKGKRQPVLLQHGVLMDGTTWVLLSPEQSLAFILADEGFDVWISNIRGTRWSRRHVSLDPSSTAFWSWSWDELAAYDLPATVDFVVNQTGQKLHYVGHSMGTTIVMSALSERKLVEKLKSTALLTPVAYLTHMGTPLGIIAARTFLGENLRSLGLGEFNLKGEVVEDWLKGFCGVPGVSCYAYLASFTGINCCLNGSTVDVLLEYEPQPTSVKTMVHFAQTYRDGVITKYNYDSVEENMFHYGRSEPPVYNMANIPQDFPMFLSYGALDLLSDVQDVELLLKDLEGHHQDKLTVQFVKEYAHLDFVLGSNAKSVVYDGMIQFIKTHN